MNEMMKKILVIILLLTNTSFANVIETNDKNYQKDVVEAVKEGTSVVVEAYADWCGACRYMSPIFKEVAGKRTDVRFVKINVDENSKNVSVNALPTIFAINAKKRTVTKYIGAFENTAEFEKWLDEVLK